MKDSTKRFSNRVENYIKYRPHYPKEIVEALKVECGLRADSIIADVGSGTGILTALFLQNGCRVLAIEPNRDMREAGERWLKGYDGFTSVTGTAEATTLADQSVDFVTAGQAFHWFDPQKARDEFSRILKPQGWAVLIWNQRHTDESEPFMYAYHELLRAYAVDYDITHHTHFDIEVLRAFFAPNVLHIKTFDNYQHFDFEGMKGRVLSSSYSPAPGHPTHEAMIEALESLFEAHQVNGKVTFKYKTKVYYGKLTG